MVRPAIVLPFLFAFLYVATSAQTGVTMVSRLEVDEKEVIEDYRVIFDAGNYWIEARRTGKGFIIPDAVKDQGWIRFIFQFGKHQLNFSNIHRSKFQSEWVVGVDERPFSPEIVPRGKMKKTLAAYYIEFLAGHGTKVVITVERDD